MGQQELSTKAQEAITALKALPLTELARAVAIVSADLATKIAGAVQTATPAQLNKASSNVVTGIQAARGHGFKKVKAPDGTDAIEVKITRPNGNEVTCLLSEGARGKKQEELTAYGEEQLKKATLLRKADFEAVVERLFTAIQGQKEVKGVLQTGDAALNQVHQTVTRGVRIAGGFSWVVFNLDERGAVAGRSFSDGDYNWHFSDESIRRNFCALFGASPAESK